MQQLILRNLFSFCQLSLKTLMTTPRPKIAPSLLSCDFSKLGIEAKNMTDCGADYLHLDVMDGHFVPNLTFGAPIIKCLRKTTNAFLDCHLMVSNPKMWISDFKDAGADGFTFHFEAVEKGQHEIIIKEIKQAGMKVGLSVKPKTAIEEIDSLLCLVDMVLIMTVEPGFGGQAFMEDCIAKVRHVRAKCPHIDIQVDGGIDLNTIDIAAAAGANVVVAGTSIFKAEDPKFVIRKFKECILSHSNSWNKI